jgi:Peptidyl-tRNA hydrolase
MRVCNAIAVEQGVEWKYKKKYKAYTASFAVENQDIILLKSKWPMNLNGRSLQKIGKFLSQTMELLVIPIISKF